MKFPKNLLLVTFDLIHVDDPETSFSIASIIAALRGNVYYKDKFLFQHLSFNLFDPKENSVETILNRIRCDISISSFDYIALSAYVWSDHLINPLIKRIKEIGFKGLFILGGNQITNTEELSKIYPLCDIFIIGYAEGAILRAILDDHSKYPIELQYIPKHDRFFSPFIYDVYSKEEKYINIRTETKRGCSYQCSFCGHKDLLYRQIIEHSKERFIEELDILKTLKPSRINIIDPIFTQGKFYKFYFEQIEKIEIESQIKIQSRFEHIISEKNEDFLNICKKINVLVEIGVQTIFKNESKVLRRHGDTKIILEGIKKLNNAQIPFEVSVIYGIPNQTVDSLKTTIEFLSENGCKVIKAFPLMLIRGTQLFQDKDKYDLKEKNFGKLNLPYVVSCNSFTEKEWYQMNDYVQKKLNQDVI